MNTELERRKQEITRSQGRRKLWQRIVSALAAVVMFVTTYVLILPVEAQNRTFCEQEAHEHSAENGCYVETKTLKCEEEHEHTDECYITLLTLICQHEEHVHNKECYADKTADIETQADWEASIKAAKLTGEWSKDIIAVASTQLGYRESEKNYIVNEQNEIKGYTRYGDWIGDKYVDWSAAFVAFCVNYTGISKDEMTYDKAPEEWVKALQNQKLYNESIEEVNPGDIVFIDENGDNKADRVGIVVEQSEDKIKTVEGDLNNAVAYFEYELSAQTARTDVDSSNEESNLKDFSEEKSTTGRAARAEEKPIIIGSVSLPVNPNYNPPIAITDPENTTSPNDRIKVTEAPATPPNSNKEATRAANIPTLTGLAATTKVAVLFNGNIEEFATLADAMNFIDTAGNYEFTVVFTQANTNDATGWNAVAAKGSGAKKISFTSIYNDGAANITSTVTFPNNPSLYFSAETEFFNLDLKATGNNCLYMRGNKFTASEGITTTIDASNWLQIYGGNYNTPHPNAAFTGNPDITILSGKWTYVMAGGFLSATTANASIYIGGSAEITAHVVAGGNNSTFTGDSVITVAGDAVVYMINAGGHNSNSAGNVTVNLTERAQVTHAIVAGNSANGNADSITYNLDGTNGAYANKVYFCPANSGTTPAKTVLTANIKNMKDISVADFWSRSNGSGRVLFEGDCHIQYQLYASANLDVELADNATLQMGSNAELTQPGLPAGNLQGALLLYKSLIMNANSKLIMAGNSLGANGSTYRTIKDIDVRGAGAEIDIYKRAATTYPIYVTGEKLGNDKLNLGIFKAQDVDTDDPSYGAILLTFSTEADAQEENHAPGAVTKGSTYEYDLDGVHKSGKNIIVCKGMDDPIDVANGRLVFSLDCATQYVGDTNTIYAHDHALKPSYRIKGTNTVNYYNDKILVEPEVHVELIICEDLYLYGGNVMFNVTDSFTTITLMDNTVTTLHVNLSINNRFDPTPGNLASSSPNPWSGCIVKNGMEGELTIQCERCYNNPGLAGHLCDENSCGKLNCNRTGYAGDSSTWDAGGCHVAGIGSIAAHWGFANLYVKGGVINIPKAAHVPSIGANCGPAHYTCDDYCIVPGTYTYGAVNPENSAAEKYGQICSNLNFSGGRVYAYGGDQSSGIGSGSGVTVDGIYITDNAYVYAEGGAGSAAIGCGSYDVYMNKYYFETAIQQGFQNIGRVRNIVISGGATVVEAVGSDVPAIGPGGCIHHTNRTYVGPIIGDMTDVYADPDSGYVAIVRQGDTPNRDLAEFIPGSPSDDRIDILTNKWYTLAYFTQIHKTAQVSSGGAFSAQETGTQALPVMVNVGDAVKYTITTGIIADSNGAVTGSLVDVLPEGMTFSGSGATPASGFSYSYDDSSKRYTVRWDNISFNEAHEFSVNVTVNNLPTGVNEKTFENQAVLVHSDGTNEIPLNSNWTYHKVVRQAPPEFDLTIEKTVVGAGTGPFSFTVTFTDASGDPVNIPAPAANAGYTVANNVATFDLNKDDSVTITGIPVDTVATIVETSHNGYTVQYNFSDGTPSVSGDTASVTITDDLTVTCINNAGFELPHTGGGGTLILTFSGAILMATALTYGMAVRRRRERREFSY